MTGLPLLLYCLRSIPRRFVRQGFSKLRAGGLPRGSPQGFWEVRPPVEVAPPARSASEETIPGRGHRLSEGLVGPSPEAPKKARTLLITATSVSG